ncbi:MAG: hypothetical protein FWH18_09920 [Marinilabiliaceae bacterium]|nr:hypothetical protein [Marinilabiliaceae bacterium]
MKNLLFVFVVLFCSCAWSQQSNIESKDQYDSDFYQYIIPYKQTEIDSIILNNDYTIFFAWTEWCGGGHFHLKEDLFPFLKVKPNNIGVVSLYCGSTDKAIALLKENDCRYPVYLLSDSFGGFDKIKFNRFFKKIFKNYKSVNYVPIVILCDSQKQILNWNKVNKDYDGIGSAILLLKNKYFFDFEND